MDTTRLRLHHWRAIADLTAELASLPSHDIDGGSARLLDWLTRSTGASGAFIVLARNDERDRAIIAHDPLAGWRPRRIIYHRQTFSDIERRWALYARDPDQLFDPKTRALSRTAGRHRAFLRHELVDDRTWSRCPLVRELWPAIGITDRLMGAAAVDPRAEVYVSLERRTGERPFRELERQLLAAVIERVAWFHGRLAWSHGLASPDAMFSPREREVLGHLLSPSSEKQIAASLGLTTRSSHQYIVSIYRRLGVSSRAELMARSVLGRTPALAAPRARPRSAGAFRKDPMRLSIITLASQAADR